MKNKDSILLLVVALLFLLFAQPIWGQSNNNSQFSVYLPFSTLNDVAPSEGSTSADVNQGFRYGIQAHILHRHEADRVMAATADMGLGWVKQQVEWRVFEPTQGAIRYFMLDQMVLSANEKGTGLLFSVTHAPDWARENGFDTSVDGPPADPQTMANFLKTIAERYCGSSLQAIEVWNEPNLAFEWGNRQPNAGEYMNLMAASYRAVKDACPSMAVVSAGLAPTGAELPLAIDDQLYMAQMLDANLLSSVDAIGAHPSGYNVPPTAAWQDACSAIDNDAVATFRGPCDSPHRSWSFRSTLEGYHQLLVDRQSDKPIWVTEFGWAAGGSLEPGYEYANDNSFEEQAQWSVEAFQMMQEWEWVTGAFLWNLNFRYIDPNTERAQWSIISQDWQHQPALTALEEMQKPDEAVIPAILAASFEPVPFAEDSSEPVQIPEPITVILFGSGLAGLAGYASRHKRKQ